ncbi:exodeoxyribonuclease VII large subunit [Peptoniphilus equinus]|uniref:Exodeoxyribonuclease 7 large subunit n=1 Tax=Peptoniphilus equinus TaxID=3016343 RepID=A0ABY7QXC3_9FIRM|nr:exodeoxyribonuclease VII large subunit [Peptoniphilus equinus]WBW50593.1 exodeoxyribonuclease VII large subunit [Peptoniphilus equinus]
MTSAIQVKELNKYIKKYIAMDYLLANVTVEGEITDLTKHSNGNYYLTLKDDGARVRAVVYYTDVARLGHDPKNGDHVYANGAVSVFERDASLTYFIRKLELAGVGTAMEAFLALKDKLQEEGLFEKKQGKIPYFPQKVGIVTSKDGAAIEDIINVLTRRNPAVEIVLYPALVQGDRAPDELLAGMNYFEKSDVDVVVLTRGGGAYEDLQAFNDETLARFVASMSKPVISAVGHEIDYVITDYVSDLRAPTPSSAAELVARSHEELITQCELTLGTLRSMMLDKIKRCKNDVIPLKPVLNRAVATKRYMIRSQLNFGYSALRNFPHQGASRHRELELERRYLEKLIQAKPVVARQTLRVYKDRLNLPQVSKTHRTLQNAVKSLNAAVHSKNHLSYKRRLAASKAVMDAALNRTSEAYHIKLQALSMADYGKKLAQKMASRQTHLTQVFTDAQLMWHRDLGDKETALRATYHKLARHSFSNAYVKSSEGTILRSAKDAKVKDQVTIVFYDGSVTSEILKVGDQHE